MGWLQIEATAGLRLPSVLLAPRRGATRRCGVAAVAIVPASRGARDAALGALLARFTTACGDAYGVCTGSGAGAPWVWWSCRCASGHSRSGGGAGSCKLRTQRQSRQMCSQVECAIQGRGSRLLATPRRAGFRLPDSSWPFTRAPEAYSWVAAATSPPPWAARGPAAAAATTAHALVGHT